jgi:hypothetical protein
VIDLCFAPEVTHHAHTVVDCLAVGQSIAQGTDERVILFVKLIEGEGLSGELEKRIKHEIRTRRSARHVPAKVSWSYVQIYASFTAVHSPKSPRDPATLRRRVLTMHGRSSRCRTSPIPSMASEWRSL